MPDEEIAWTVRTVGDLVNVLLKFPAHFPIIISRDSDALNGFEYIAAVNKGWIKEERTPTNFGDVVTVDWTIYEDDMYEGEEWSDGLCLFPVS